MDRNDLAIDPNNLEEEWMKQPILYERAVNKMIDEMRMRDEAKYDLDKILVETASDIRKNPGNYGIEKLTESAIIENRDSDENVLRAQKLYNSMNQNYNLARGFLDAVENRKRALEKLVDLWKGQYFSTPREPNMQIEGGKRLGDSFIEKAENTQRRGMRKSRYSTNPVTTEEERNSKTREEKLDEMTPETRKQVLEIEKKREESSKEETPNTSSVRRRKRPTLG